jgi:hypothetical protein
MKHKLVACSEYAGRRIESVISIYDFTGVSLTTLNKTAF